MIKPFNPLTATASDHLQQLSQGSLTSVQLVDVYLAQIYARNDYLKAVIDIVPTERLLSQAEKLDVERKAGTLRGSLHGIPILIKDNIATHPSLSLRTACGSFLLAESRPAKNADIVDKLVDSGAIILGKANLSEMSYWKGDGLPCGWSALGGQTQSPYVRGGFDKNEDSPGGHSSTGGSSSGSAAGVAAGFAPVSIGSETNGSLIMPGTRAALYTIKPTIGLVSTQGIVPICPMTDSAGPMTKCARDLAIMMDVLVDPSTTKVPIGGYTSCLNMLMADLRVCALDPTKWMLDEQICKPDKGASEQMLRDNLAAYKQIESHAKAFHWNVPLVSPSDLKAREEESLYDLYDNDFQDAIEEYLGQLESSPVRTLEELIAGNEKMAEKELPPGESAISPLQSSHITYPPSSVSRHIFSTQAVYISTPPSH